MTIIKTETQQQIKKQKKLQYGKVIVDKNDKTITVLVEKQKRHPLYKKQYKKQKKYHIHDEKNIAKVGDFVAFVNSHPYSKSKRWRLVEILKITKEAEAN